MRDYLIHYQTAVARIDAAMREHKRGRDANGKGKLIADAFDAALILSYLFGVPKETALADLQCLYLEREAAGR